MFATRTSKTIMNLSYDLSNRQQHALDRGEVLTLAIPLDPEGDDIISEGSKEKVLGWFVERIPAIHDLWIDFQGVVPIVVDPVINPVGSDLSKRLGTILTFEGPKYGFVMDVAVIEVTNPDKPRRGKTKVQWPGGKLTFEPYSA